MWTRPHHTATTGSSPSQPHHPHTLGTPPNDRLISTDLEGQDGGYVPSGLQVVQAHWYVRHGERAPVRRRMTGLAGMPEVFRECRMGKDFQVAVVRALEGEEAGMVRVRRVTEDMGKDNDAVLTGSNDCYWGQLTDVGRVSTNRLGQSLRALYVDQLRFLPSTLPNVSPSDSPVFFRSTAMPRTMESLFGIIGGLYPEGKRDGTVQFTVRKPVDESLYPNSLCGRMKVIDREFAARAAKEWNGTLVPLDGLISKYIDGAPVRIDGTPRANGILDTIISSRAHGIPVPKEFEDTALLETLETAVVHEWFDGYKSLEFTTLAMGRLLGDLKFSMNKARYQKSGVNEKGLKLAVYACHDTSLGGILNALKVFNSRWPPFTSHISFELLRPTTPSPSLFSSSPAKEPHFVRMRYNAQPIYIPQCAGVGMHLEGRKDICTWEAFERAVGEVEIGGEGWEKGCKV